MKKVLIICILLLSFNNLFSQRAFEDGYITLNTGEDLFVEVMILNSSKLKVRENGEVKKYEKKNLEDYGYVIDGVKKSKFAATAFVEAAYEGYYVSGHNSDTTEIYFIAWDNRILYFYDKQSLEYKRLEKHNGIQNITINYDDGVKKYDRVEHNLNIYKNYKDNVYFDSQICLLIDEGNISIYTGHLVQETLGYGEYGVQTVIVKIPCYILRRPDTMLIIQFDYEKMDIETFNQLKNLLQDYPEFVGKLNIDTLKKKDIPKMIKEYNKHFRLEK
jgi:hypothetical protein